MRCAHAVWRGKRLSVHSDEGRWLPIAVTGKRNYDGSEATAGAEGGPRATRSGLRERIEGLGGKMEVEAQPGLETPLYARLPCAERRTASGVAAQQMTRRLVRQGIIGPPRFHRGHPCRRGGV